MTELHHTQGTTPALHTASTEPPERITALVVGLLAVGFSTWVLLTLPIRRPLILTVAAVVASSPGCGRRTPTRCAPAR